MKFLDEETENSVVPFVIMRKFERKSMERKSICESRVVKAMASIE